MDSQVLKDIQWWLTYLPYFNGVATAWMKQMLTADSVVTADASGTGVCVGGVVGRQEIFPCMYPPSLVGCEYCLHGVMGSYYCTEVLGVTTSKRIVMYCDNESVVNTLTYGCSRDLFLQVGMREVAYILATQKFELRILYVCSRDNFVSDWLSRWSDRQARVAFHRFARNRSLQYTIVNMNEFRFTHDW